MSVSINLAGIDRMLSKAEVRKRQTEYAMRAAHVMRKYVPEDETTLRASEPLNSRYADGLLIWNTPYAAKQYYVPMNHKESKNPQGTDHWDEECWKKDGKDLLSYAESLYEGY